MSSFRIPVPCPSCRRSLRIRVENLGRMGICQHCGHRFRAAPDESAGRSERPRGTLEADFQDRLSRLASQSAQPADAFRQRPTTSNRVAQIQEVIDQAQLQGRSTSGPLRDRGEGGFEWADRGVVGSRDEQAQPLVEFNPELDELEVQFEAEHDALVRELEWLRSRLREAEQARDAWKREAESLRQHASANDSSALCFSCLSHPDA